LSAADPAAEACEPTAARRDAGLNGASPSRPPHWGGYRLVPDAFEFWQGRPSRLHDRLAYTPDGNGGWKIQWLAP